MPAPTETRVVSDATCLHCTCMCDDVEVTVRGDQIVETANACPLGRSWFLDRQQTDDGLLPICTIDGRPAPLEDGLDLAARLLTAANERELRREEQTQL